MQETCINLEYSLDCALSCTDSVEDVSQVLSHWPRIPPMHKMHLSQTWFMFMFQLSVFFHAPGLLGWVPSDGTYAMLFHRQFLCGVPADFLFTTCSLASYFSLLSLYWQCSSSLRRLLVVPKGTTQCPHVYMNTGNCISTLSQEEEVWPHRCCHAAVLLDIRVNSFI